MPYVIDPANPARLLLGTNRVYQTNNRGNKWTAISTPLNNGWNTSAQIDALAVARTDSAGNPAGNTIYATAAGKIFVTTTGGTTWTERDVPGFTDHFQSLLVDPANSGCGARAA